MNTHIAPVELGKAYRLINHGPTVLVSASHDGVDDVMAAAWSCGLEAFPAKLTVVLDKSSKTRELLERSGRFVVQVPTMAQAKLTHAVGTRSLRDDPEKLKRCGVEVFRLDGHDTPFVQGCSAWLACRLIPEPHNQETYDLFIGEIIGAWADARVFQNGHWMFENAEPGLRSIHYIAGGHFYAIGEPLIVPTNGQA
jgi:flavin reductase (DIM6/NTAB) family NADH-FMN oxidoreductase RutF